MTSARTSTPTPSNGTTPGAAVAFAGAAGGASAYDDPMSRVLGLDERTSGVAAWFFMTP